MDRLGRYRKLLTYDDWANREVLKSIKSAEENLPGAAARPLKLLAHVIASEWLWLKRLGAPSGQMAVWPELEREECETQLDLLSMAWDRYLEASSDEQLGDSVAYVSSKGEPWSSRVEDILEHVVMHGAYHRGQIAAAVRAAGMAPAYTDFIHAVRSGVVS
jgi:uncharacterized damage-inducible protein DinB